MAGQFSMLMSSFNMPQSRIHRLPERARSFAEGEPRPARTCRLVRQPDKSFWRGRGISRAVACPC